MCLLLIVITSNKILSLETIFTKKWSLVAKDFTGWKFHDCRKAKALISTERIKGSKDGWLDSDIPDGRINFFFLLTVTAIPENHTVAFREVMSKERVCTPWPQPGSLHLKDLSLWLAHSRRGMMGSPGEGPTGIFLRLKSKSKWLDPG